MDARRVVGGHDGTAFPAMALVVAVPMGIAMGVSPVVANFLTPLFRFRRLSANNFRALWSAQDRLSRLGVIKATFDVNKHVEAKHFVNVMAKHPGLFSDLPAIPADVAIKPGYVFTP